MIGWQLPAALWGLAAAAIPIVIHLLRMHRAARVEFPSLRFVRAAQTAAVRIQPPSDLWLMLLRAGAVAAAVVALAGPVLMTRSRLASWDARVARAIVVDTSESMRAGAAARAASAADAEAGTAAYSRRFDSPALAAGVAEASAWLARVPPSRREVVVLSDFQRGALAAADVAALPATLGVRLVPIKGAAAPASVAGPDLLAPDGGVWAQTVRMTAETTAVTVERGERRQASGIRFVDADERRADTDALLRAVASAGAPAGSAGEPIALWFADDPASRRSTPISPVPSGWMTSTVVRMRADASLVAVSRAASSARTLEPALSGADGWAVVARDAADRPVVAAAATGQELLLAIAAAPRSLLAAAALRAALAALRPPDRLAEHEIAAIDSQTLMSWNRPAPPLDLDRRLDPDRLRAVDRTEARWCWALALILLAIEQWARARRVEPEKVEANRVAA